MLSMANSKYRRAVAFTVWMYPVYRLVSWTKVYVGELNSWIPAPRV
jgi:hypothetical protein